jgi:hypothetical protein
MSSEFKFSYPPDWWQQPRREARKANAREYIANYKRLPNVSKQEAARFRLILIRLILAGLLEHDPNTKGNRITDLGRRQLELAETMDSRPGPRARPH